MTVIAALVQDGRVHMAADTQSMYCERAYYGPGKVFTLPVGKKRAVLGCAGDGGLLTMVRTQLDLGQPDSGEPADLDAWAADVAATICAIANDAKPAPTDDDDALDGATLMGYAGHVWLLVQQDAIRILDPFTALGSGAKLAIGALAVLPGDLMPAREQLEAAVEVACRFDPACSVTAAGMRYEVV